MKKMALIILFISISVIIHAQERYKDQLGLINEIKEYCTNTLGLHLSKRFYAIWATNENPNLILYISEKSSNRILKTKWFGSKGNEKALSFKYKYDSLGYVTLLYKTYGTSATRLTEHLLSYSLESISFIAFHEAIHQHDFDRKTGKVPPQVIEALCDLIGNYATVDFFKMKKTLDVKKAKRGKKEIEKIAGLINNIAKNNQDIVKKQYEIEKLTKAIANLDNTTINFKIDRYNYDINSAYIARNLRYTKTYFELKSLLLKTKDVKTFLNIVFAINDRNYNSFIDKLMERVNAL